ncbi:peptide deformylase [Candidatus Ruminimicrobiellum ovillum]|uniref:peptide deformylase n=1 Tax=Candidatus Ruminimicrobiellum ovillum TaxID=1947927 RepID=UPI00355A6AEE
MAILKIVKYGDPVLRKKTAPVTEITDDIIQLAEDMLETMYAAPGVGLAGPQVGVSLQICVIDVVPEGKRNPIVLINPKVLSGENKVELEEGCLSFPKIYEKVKRWNKVRVEYVDLKGNLKEVEVEGFLAKAFQHEIDHLNGKVFIDYLPDWKRKLVEKEIRRRKKGKNW